MSLIICKKCGWHTGPDHASFCHPLAGEAAQRLIDFCRFAHISATKLGYGQRCVGITLGHVTLVLDVSINCTFSVKRLFMSTITEADAGKLAIVLDQLVQSMTGEKQ